MSRGLPRAVRENLEKARQATLAAVEVYNKPGGHFRTAHYIVLMIIAWTSLFHAIFFRKGTKPWYRKPNTGKRILYQKTDGEHRHWDLAECLRQHFGADNPAERANLEFILGLRHKIEHRSLPELDPALYGECQAMLMNLEAMLTSEFGEKYALGENLSVSLQFSRAVPAQRAKALKKLASTQVRGVQEYVERFRGGLSLPILNSTKYSFSVYLIPKVANRASAADISVEFIPYDPSKPDEMQQLEKVAAMIKEKQIPVYSKNLLKPGQVVSQLEGQVPFPVNLHVHTKCWKHFKVRPESGSDEPAKTDTRYCYYDDLNDNYGYTKAWVRFLAKKLGDADSYRKIAGKKA